MGFRYAGRTAPGRGHHGAGRLVGRVSQLPSSCEQRPSIAGLARAVEHSRSRRPPIDQAHGAGRERLDGADVDQFGHISDRTGRTCSLAIWAPPETGSVRSRPVLDVQTLTDGGQTAEAMADRVVRWLGEARESLDLALYDVRLRHAGAVADAIRGAHARGVAVRIASTGRARAKTSAPFCPAPPDRAARARDARRAVKPIPDGATYAPQSSCATAPRSECSMNGRSTPSEQGERTRHDQEHRRAAAFTSNFEQIW